MSDDGEVLTSEQMEALQTELAELEGPRRAAAIEAIATARSFGDLSARVEEENVCQVCGTCCGIGAVVEFAARGFVEEEAIG